MKILITESVLNSIIENWLNKNYGDLERFNRTEFREIYLSKNGRFKIMYNLRGKQLYIVREIWDFISNMFSLDYEETGKFLLNWCNDKFGFRAKVFYRVDEI
jgi:hypothetical protein